MNALLCALAVLGENHTVPGDFPTIQAAVNASSEGDSIFVYPGSYAGFSYCGKDVYVGSLDGPEETHLSSVVTFSGGESRNAVLDGFAFDEIVLDWHSSSAIHAVDASPSILNNVFNDLGASSGGEDATALGIITGFFGDSHPLLENNVFSSNDFYWDCYYPSDQGQMLRFPYSYLYGLCLYAENSGGPPIELRNNVFELNHTTGIGVLFFGGVVSLAGSALLENNLFCDNSVSSYQGTVLGTALYCCRTGNFSIVNCVFSGNFEVGYPETASLYLASDTCIVINSIIWNDKMAAEGGTILDVSYCDIEDGWSGAGNINADPMFFSGPLSDFHLDTEISPCIDAGDPSSIYNDPEDPQNPGNALWPSLGGLRNDMGIYGGSGRASGSVGIEADTSAAILTVSIRAFPNPSSGSVNIVFDLPDQGPVDVSLYDLSGRRILTVEGDFDRGRHSLMMDTSGLPTGTYVLLLRAGALRTSCRITAIR